MAIFKSAFKERVSKKNYKFRKKYKIQLCQMLRNLDLKSINTIRALAADVVQKANSGHPGAPMGCAPMAHVLFSRFLNVSPANPSWVCDFELTLDQSRSICTLQWSWMCIALHFTSFDGLRALDARFEIFSTVGFFDSWAS